MTYSKASLIASALSEMQEYFTFDELKAQTLRFSLRWAPTEQEILKILGQMPNVELIGRLNRAGSGCRNVTISLYRRIEGGIYASEEEAETEV